MKIHPQKWFKKIGNTPIIPLSLKIMTAFVILLLISTFSTNYLNLVLNQRELVKKNNELLVKELKDIYSFASNQFDIFQFSGDKASALESISKNASRDLKMPNSTSFGFMKDGTILYLATNGEKMDQFPDKAILEQMNALRLEGITEGSIHYAINKGDYFGVYKYLDKWECYIVRSELFSDMLSSTNKIFRGISLLIIALTLVFIVIGLLCINHLLRFLRQISESMLTMQDNQTLDLIDLDHAPNDDVTYLGASFNSLSSTINNLLSIFRKFVTQDVVERAYQEHRIRLEGKQMELAILFSDIRGFTYMTETLGNDIIDLLNVHYDRAIKCVHEENGIVGSIIGDAILAVYGTLRQTKNKALEAIISAYAIQKVTETLRTEMKKRRADIEKQRPLTESEERVFEAVLIDVGVGIDGGKVFYGNIGSQERMTNTVIGDNVNSASRLEGLTRIYELPVICSEYIKDEVMKETNRYLFVEIDMVQVKGKTEGKRIYYPLDTQNVSPTVIEQFMLYSVALSHYYTGDWAFATESFKKCGLSQCSVFFDRMGKVAKAGEGWRGIWTMTTK